MIEKLFNLEAWAYVGEGIKMAVDFAPIWLPALLLVLVITMWMRYIRLQYVMDQDYVLMEIKLPEDIRKSPAAMELVFNAMYQSSIPTLYKVFVQGEVMPWFSLELVSIGGEVHFFIWCSTKYSHLVKTQIYAQYPDAEIYDVPDYTNFIQSDDSEVDMWGTYFKQTGDDVDPIKTYMDYKLDKPDKPEEQINPITSVLEYLGNLQGSEQAWIQILVRAHRDLDWTSGEAILKRKEWKEKVKKKVKEEMPKSEKDSEGNYKWPVTEPGQDDYIKTLKRQQTKLPFEVAIRGMYLAEPDDFVGHNIVGLIGSFRQYNHHGDNGFKLGYFTDVSEFWKNLNSVFPVAEPILEKKRARMKKEFFEAYRLRSFFYPPYEHWHAKPYVLTSEELATIYHFPGGVAQTPTFKRLDSKKGEPPSNLPS